MSRRDLERKLREKGASEAEAHYAAEWMEAIGAINDADYAAALVRHCGEKGYGPARVREKLHEKGGAPGAVGGGPGGSAGTRPGRSTASCCPSSEAGPRMRRRKSAFVTPWPAGALPGRISGQPWSRLGAEITEN